MDALSTTLLISVLLAFYFILEFRRNKIKDGKIFVSFDKNFKARVIVDHSIPTIKDKFIPKGCDRISGNSLAESCRISMKAVYEVLKNEHKRIRESESHSISPCYFVFLSKNNFNSLMKENGFQDPSLVKALSKSIKTKHFFNFFEKTNLVVFLKAEQMSSVAKKGGIVLHELVHVASFKSYDHWDKDHKMWDSVEFKRRRKTLDKILLERWDCEFKNQHK